MDEIEQDIVKIASLIGDRSRALMLWYLLDGRAYTATELAIVTDISAQSASNHLARLVGASILKVEKQGRHRYYNFSNAQVAYAIESLNTLAAPQKHSFPKRVESKLTKARTCYDHIAGKLGIRITESLMQQKIITYRERDAFDVTPYGEEWFGTLGIKINELRCGKRRFAFPCLDWSERKHHLAGALGASLLEVFLHKKWVKKVDNSRALMTTWEGDAEIESLLKM